MSLPSFPDTDPHQSTLRQRREWTVQRIFLGFLYIAVLAVILGLFGNGVFSQASIGSAGTPLQMEYERFLRYRSAEDLRITVHNRSHTVRLILSKAYFSNIGVQRIMPEPRKVLMTEKAVILTFNSAPSETSVITVIISPDHLGTQRGWIAVDDFPPQFFSHFIYP